METLISGLIHEIYIGKDKIDLQKLYNEYFKTKFNFSIEDYNNLGEKLESKIKEFNKELSFFGLEILRKIIELSFKKHDAKIKYLRMIKDLTNLIKLISSHDLIKFLNFYKLNVIILDNNIKFFIKITGEHTKISFIFSNERIIRIFRPNEGMYDIFRFDLTRINEDKDLLNKLYYSIKFFYYILDNIILDEKEYEIIKSIFGDIDIYDNEGNYLSLKPYYTERYLYAPFAFNILKYYVYNQDGFWLKDFGSEQRKEIIENYFYFKNIFYGIFKNIIEGKEIKENDNKIEFNNKYIEKIINNINIEGKNSQ